MRSVRAAGRLAVPDVRFVLNRCLQVSEDPPENSWRSVTVRCGELLLFVVSFESSAIEHGPRLRAGLVSAYGPDVGLDAAAEAMAYGFEHWQRLSTMQNPSGYLYRVGQTAAKRSRRSTPSLPAPPISEMPMIEPGLVPALNDLTELQRTCVLLVRAFGWKHVETAALLEISESSVRTHIRRGMNKLQQALKGNCDVH